MNIDKILNIAKILFSGLGTSIVQALSDIIISHWEAKVTNKIQRFSYPPQKPSASRTYKHLRQGISWV